MIGKHGIDLSCSEYPVPNEFYFTITAKWPTINDSGFNTQLNLAVSLSMNGCKYWLITDVLLLSSTIGGSIDEDDDDDKKGEDKK